ncbi:hypothetical protein LTR84_007986 [Exophiala bonariae]|uniref:Zn(2)-C6 fungal-type domain-containing protein n=1 Tax=Exophiala bonariae TaxID=1690606 RepID=A0AAV9NLM4_9EURO|nr:hypothetical protein LTR84_007986 [Exophiala bonariae]
MIGSVTNYHYKTPRRQNRSCDHCRRYKRACDAALSQWTGCSNCLRLGKTCTFESINGHNPSTKKTNAPPKHHATFKESSIEPTTRTLSAGRSRKRTTSSQAHTDQHYSKNETAAPGLPLTSYFDRINSIEGLHCQTLTRHDQVEFYPNAPVPDFVDTATWDYAQDGVLQVHLDEERSSSLDAADSLYYDLSTGAALETPAFSFEDQILGGDTNVPDIRASTQDVPRFALPGHYLAEQTNKALISTSLKHIYSDTLENALLCWVTEQSCPYNNEGILASRPRKLLFARTKTVSKHGMVRRIQRLDRASCVLTERPLTPREIRLASRALNTVIMAFASQWSQLEGAKSSNLFNGHTGGLGQRHFQEFEELISASLFDFAETKLASFDRSLQVTLWNEAYQALQQAMGIDSFQVAFAQVIFGFTQRPLSSEDFQRVKNYGQETNDYFGSKTCQPTGSGGGVPWSDDGHTERSVSACTENAPEFSETQELLDLDKDPLHLRDSLMRLSAKRVKLSTIRPQSTRTPILTEKNSPDENEFLADRMTFNQLFWLVMMCDTLSAAINNRLPIVSDEDSIILSEDRKMHRTQGSFHPQNGAIPSARSSNSIPQARDDTESDVEDNPWGMYFLGRHSEANAVGAMQWPFSKESASVLLSEAAPVKALLYRKVKQLQNAQFRRASAMKLEQLIQGALKVYEYWNQNYGKFITTCIQHHDELPPQIQSWYSVLTSHWNLACYLLSDLIEEVDQAGETDKRHSAIRKSCSLLFHIKRQSAFEMGDLGRVGRVRQDCSFSQMNDFHPTVNDGALLTEPWTEIMIRSFARVSVQFLTWLSEIDHPLNTSSHMWAPGDQDRIYASLGDCVEALLDLGRKSDMAFLLAISLKRRMVRFSPD